MRWAVLLAVSLSVSLSGCFFGHCGFMPDAAVWNDPALWGAVEAEVEPAQGIPTDDGQIAISGITFRDDGAFGRHDGDALVAMTRGGTEDQVLAAGARAILENGTAMDATQIDDAVAAFLASRNVTGTMTERHSGGEVERDVATYRHPVTLNGTLLLQRLGVEPGQPVSGPFSLTYDAAKKQIDLDGRHLTVDAMGRATMEYRWPEGSSTDEVTDDVHRLLDEAGLPVPADGTIEVQGAIC